MRNGWWLAILWLCVGLLPAAAQRTPNLQTAFRSDPLAQALQHESVYVGKSLRSQVDERGLRDLASKAPADRPVKLVVVNQLPESGNVFGSRDLYTRALHTYLNMGRGTLLIRTTKGVSASTNGLQPERITAILQQDAATIQNDPVGGFDRALTDLYAAMDDPNAPLPSASTTTSSTPVTGQATEAEKNLGFLLIIVLPFILFLLFIVWIVRAMGRAAARAGERQAMRQATLPVARLRKEVVDGLSYVDTYLDLLPASPELQANRGLRQDTAALYEQAKTVAQGAQTPQDLGRAEALLEQANQNVAVLKQFIDRATGGTGFAVAIEGTDYRVTPGSSHGATAAAPVLTGMNPADIPPAERAACFFCSRPARISELTPVIIALNGQRRKVLACADDIHSVQRGATPQVRTVMENGKPTAWHRARSYDPYRDYYRTGSYAYYPAYTYYDGYDSGVWDGFLLGSLFSEPAPLVYPVFYGNDGYASNDPIVAALPLDTVDYSPDTTTSSDFFGDNARFDTVDTSSSGSYDSGGSVDFGSSSWDSGSSFDSGGSSDFSSSDSGSSSDFGSSGGDY